MSCGNDVRDEKDMSEEEREGFINLMDTPVFDGWNCDSCHRKDNFCLCLGTSFTVGMN